jgi:hypothetical protein
MALKQASRGDNPLKRFLFPIESPRKNQSWKGGEDPLKGSLEVTDLFKGAFLLCMGARLDRVRVRNNGRRIATFLITGKDLDRHDSDYRSGRALVNPVQLRESLNHLRDVMFEKLRNQEGRKTDGHRAGGYRSSQAY